MHNFNKINYCFKCIKHGTINNIQSVQYVEIEKMIKEVSSVVARQNFGELLNEVKYCHDNVLITKAGKPIAALIDIELFEKVRKLKTQFETLTTNIGKVYETVGSEEAENEIKEALEETKRK